MHPPLKLDPLFDAHGGFTAEISSPKNGTYTLWRPGSVAKRDHAVLDTYNERSFFQNNNDVTRAVYKVKGYRYPVIAWFDNQTQKRIA